MASTTARITGDRPMHTARRSRPVALAVAASFVLAVACTDDTSEDGGAEQAPAEPTSDEADGEALEEGATEDAGQDGAPAPEDPAGTDQGSATAVTIPAGGLELQGTLRRPAGDEAHAVVVIAHGSGPHDRAGRLHGQLGLTLPAPVPVYEELAVGLQEHGYAVLTWDKRTCGPFNDCADNGYPVPPDDLAIGTLVDDVEAAVDLVAGDDAFTDVVLLGHSKGGTMALDVLAGREDLAAGVLVAAPYQPIDDVLAEQADRLATLMEAVGQTGAAAEGQLEAVRSMASAVAALRESDPDDSLEPIGGATPTFWSSWLTLSDAAPALADARTAPILFLGGEHDWNVPPEQILRWEEHTRDGDQVRVLDGITHALTRLDEPDPAAVTPTDLGTQVEPSVIDAIADWLDGTLTS